MLVIDIGMQNAFYDYAWLVVALLGVLLVAALSSSRRRDRIFRGRWGRRAAPRVLPGDEMPQV